MENQNNFLAAPHRDHGCEGFVLVTTLLIMLILMILGSFALNTTTLELRIAGNDRLIKKDFYDQEGCVITGILQMPTWLTDAYLTGDEKTVFFPPAVSSATDTNGNGIHDASECRDSSGAVLGAFKVRNIIPSDASPVAWADQDRYGGENKKKDHPANRFPLIPHMYQPEAIGDEADEYAAYGQTGVTARRFVITSYSPRDDRNIIVQRGISKKFIKYE